MALKPSLKRTCPEAASSTSLSSSHQLNQSYTDFRCIICLEILIEPVVLPCGHEFCSSCFEPHLEVTSLSCPTCRRRISNWVRDRRKRSLPLIDTIRWKLVQDRFPAQVERRLKAISEGEENQQVLDEDWSGEVLPPRILAPKGELHKEYLVEVAALEKEKADELEKDLQYVRQLAEEEKREQLVQESKDRAAALALQEEEIGHLGVTLSSPTEHQRQILQMYSPKSPIKLCGKVPSLSNARKKKKKNATIKQYFVKENDDPVPGRSKDSSFDTDIDLAWKLHRELNSVSQRSYLRPHNMPLT